MVTPWIPFGLFVRDPGSLHSADRSGLETGRSIWNTCQRKPCPGLVPSLDCMPQPFSFGSIACQANFVSRSLNPALGKRSVWYSQIKWTWHPHLILWHSAWLRVSVAGSMETDAVRWIHLVRFPQFRRAGRVSAKASVFHSLQVTTTYAGFSWGLVSGWCSEKHYWSQLSTTIINWSQLSDNIRQLWTTDCQPVTKREDWKGVRHNVSLQSTCLGSFHTVRGTCLPPWSSKRQSKRTHILTWFDCCNIPSKHSNNKVSVSFLFNLISPKNIARQYASKHLRRNIFPIIRISCCSCTKTHDRKPSWEDRNIDRVSNQPSQQLRVSN